MTTAPDPVAQFMKLVSGFQISQAISVAAVLGIGDVIGDGIASSDEIAARTGAHPEALYRLLHALAGAGVLEEHDRRRFRLTAVGECLRSGTPKSRVAWAQFLGRPYVWSSWGDMLHSVKSGEFAFAHLHATNVWQWRSERPQETAIFDAAMSELSGAAAVAIAEGYDFSQFDRIVDVGGGQGRLLAAILARHTRARGVLFDLPHVVAGAPEILRAAGVEQRCEIVGGDVFSGAPEGADAYLVKSVLMDEDDARVIAILGACRTAMKPSGRVIVIERLLPPPGQAETGSSDLMMMVMTGGRERTAGEFVGLLSEAGFGAISVVATQSPFKLIVGTPA